MRLNTFLVTGALAWAALAPVSAHAVELLVNGGFEDSFTNDLTDGWAGSPDGALITTSGVAGQFLRPGQGFNDPLGPNATAYNDVNGDPYAVSYAPMEGFQFAVLTSGAQNVFTKISQTFTLSGAGTFSGFAAFLGGDQELNPDSAYVKIFGLGAPEDPVFSASIDTLGDYGYTPWTAFSGNLGAGTYRIEAGVVNIGDDDESSRLLLDGFSVTAAVPEPSTWAMMILGFAGTGALLRRRRIAV
jgi:hypothetical protein